ncbi:MULTISPECIES: SDR family NAD(P)-dependent oxidoreductase [Natrialbaceae]|uniref:SDR family NAD(P)-dependent oxidoreductase n=1 Tax=Natrialbaceae TaxID=1644061 RepID=UPI00207D088F|nr:SDR family oxidoreductase [Natronococcus sp. CG52]
MQEVNFNFEGETVVVTGGSSGIGREIALQFAEAGATVVNGDLEASPDHVETATHELIEQRGGTATYAETDVTNSADLTALIDEAREYGGVDIMVNNAGVNFRKSILEISEEDYEAAVGVNFFGVLFGTQIAAMDMIERNVSGCIINTASIRTDLALGSQILYNSTKGAVKMITKSAALDLIDDEIRVNGISPGRTVTALADTTKNAAEMADSGQLEKEIPAERPATPKEIAPTVLYMASDATEYMTGEIITVDGGLSIY